VTGPPDSQSIIFLNQSIALSEEIRFPKVRAIDDDTAVIVNSRTWTEDNGQIISSSGKTKSFYAGDAIQDVLTTTERSITLRYASTALHSEAACPVMS
jgi:hypothetical protein